ncbi:MAG: chromate efflux transporter [Bdellovibrionota bacterium]
MSQPQPKALDTSSQSNLFELAQIFLSLGATSFGGPAAHVALMEDEFVARRKWLERDQFLALAASTHFIPGPNSTELALHIGYLRAGRLGLLVSGIAFILPAACLVWVLGWVYLTYGALPQTTTLLSIIKPVVVAVVAQATSRFALSVVRTVELGCLAVAAFLASALGAPELQTLAVAAIITGLVARLKGSASGSSSLSVAIWPFPKFAGISFAGSAASASAQGLPLFFIFLKIGSVVFGSGYVLLVFLRSELVEKLGIISEAQLLDAIAVGQITPGPLFTSATFIGYLLDGSQGALLATVGIFLPAFLLVVLTAPILARLRQSQLLLAIVTGLNAASVGLMLLVTIQLAEGALVDRVSIVCFLGAVLLLVRFNVRGSMLIAAGFALGLIRCFVG